MKLTKLIPRLGKFARRVRPAFRISLSICVLSLVLYNYLPLQYEPNSPAWLQYLAGFELKALDWWFLHRGPIAHDKRIVIVAIDQKSEYELGHWPFPRSYFADAVDFLREAGARVVAFDITFPQPDENSALEALKKVKQACTAQVGGQPSQRFEDNLDALLAQADNDKKFEDALSRAMKKDSHTNVILGYFFLTTNESAAEQNSNAKNAEIARQFLEVMSYQTYNPAIMHHANFGTNFESVLNDPPAVSPDLRSFALNSMNLGFFNVIPDPDGTVRRVPLVARYKDGLNPNRTNFYPSLDVAAALAYMGYQLQDVPLNFSENGVAGIDFGNKTIPTDSGGYVRVNYHGPGNTYTRYSLGDLVLHKLPPEDFRDKLVLIGPTATGIGDFAVTPFQQMEFPGVEVHANLIDNILNGQFVQRGIPENMIDLGFILLFSLGTGIMLGYVSPIRATTIVIVVLGFFVWLAYDLFAYHRIWILVFLPTATLTTNYAAIISYRFFFEEKEKRKVRGVFQHYMAHSLINQLLENPEQVHLGGEEKELSVMFADIRGFTTISEGLSPSKLVELLSQYLSEMTDTIFKNWGTLDKYIGDAIMAFWGAPYPQPDHAERACQAALQMLDTLKRMQAGWEAEGRPRIDIGVGVNSGPVLVGNMGSRLRFNYTVMGDNVNLASRLEGLNKEFATHLIISESAYEQVRGKFVARELDFIRVKGKKKPVRIYELLGRIEAYDHHRDLIERFGRGLEEYRGGQWESAIGVFRELRRDYPEDGPSAVFLERCRDYIAEPPQGIWDGVHVMETK